MILSVDTASIGDFRAQFADGSVEHLAERRFGLLNRLVDLPFVFFRTLSLSLLAGLLPSEEKSFITGEAA